MHSSQKLSTHFNYTIYSESIEILIVLYTPYTNTVHRFDGNDSLHRFNTYALNSYEFIEHHYIFVWHLRDRVHPHCQQESTLSTFSGFLASELVSTQLYINKPRFCYWMLAYTLKFIDYNVSSASMHLSKFFVLKRTYDALNIPHIE